MNLRPDEITGLIKSQIKNYRTKLVLDDVGTVCTVGDGISRVNGLEKCMSGELLEFENGTYGMAMNLEQDFVGCVLLGTEEGIREGSNVKRTGRIVSVPVGDAMLGRVVNALGAPIDGKGAILTDETRPVESPAFGIITRKSVNRPLQTGIKAIDSMIPVGRGQRELIIGDRQTGKTTIALDTIINQKGKNVICIYVAIDDVRLLGRPRHDRDTGQYARVVHQRHHRGRGGDRHGQPEDDGRAHHPRRRQGRGRVGRVRRPPRPCADHAGERLRLLAFRGAEGTHPRPHPQLQELTVKGVTT